MGANQVFLQLSRIFWRDADIAEGAESSCNAVDHPLFADDVIHDFTGSFYSLLSFLVDFADSSMTSYCNDIF